MGLTVMVLCSYWLALAGGQTCSLTGNLIPVFPSIYTATTSMSGD